ncbi:MAG: cyclomaltodextrinase N-terminal domain-containing protein, partial [Bacteroidales bacterium]|nr:cyclomaltodextrinase N-terminal domain-containing protein [Bacteroidales bacterium]
MKRFMATTFVAMLTAAAAWAQDVKVEPANWWVGMKNPNVQLMLHAADIAKYEPSVEWRGVEIADVTRTDNPNYLFVTLEISKNAKPGDAKITLSQGDKTINIDYPLLKRRKDSAKRIGFSSDDAFFLLMPDRFANADPSIDSTPATIEKANRNEPYARHGGDLKGVIEHLDYIKNLGMTTLWMTPVMTNDMPQSSYHGYAITNYYEIDPRF